MAVMTITDLPTNLDLDCNAMSAIRGGGAQWIFGAFQPYFKAPSHPSDPVGPVAPGGSPIGPGSSPINLYQVTNNNYFIENKVINLVNSGNNSTVNAVMISNG